MAKLTGLKFLLRDASFVAVIVTEDEAKFMIASWIDGKLKSNSGVILGSTSPPPGGWPWAVSVDSIQAIHTFALENMPQVGATYPPNMLRPGASGMN